MLIGKGTSVSLSLSRSLLGFFSGSTGRMSLQDGEEVVGVHACRALRRRKSRTAVGRCPAMTSGSCEK